VQHNGVISLIVELLDLLALLQVSVFTVLRGPKSKPRPTVD